MDTNEYNLSLSELMENDPIAPNNENISQMDIDSLTQVEATKNSSTEKQTQSQSIEPIQNQFNETSFPRILPNNQACNNIRNLIEDNHHFSPIPNEVFNGSSNSLLHRNISDNTNSIITPIPFSPKTITNLNEKASKDYPSAFKAVVSDNNKKMGQNFREALHTESQEYDERPNSNNLVSNQNSPAPIPIAEYGTPKVSPASEFDCFDCRDCEILKKVFSIFSFSHVK